MVRCGAGPNANVRINLQPGVNVVGRFDPKETFDFILIHDLSPGHGL